MEQAGQQDVNAQEDDERKEVARTPSHGKQLEDCSRRLIKPVLIQHSWAFNNQILTLTVSSDQNDLNVNPFLISKCASEPVYKSPILFYWFKYAAFSVLRCRVRQRLGVA